MMHASAATPAARVATLRDSGGAAAFADTGARIVSMAGCLPIDPYYDPEFLALASRIDPVVLNHGGWYRGLFRLAMKSDLPEAVRFRADKASFFPAIAEAACAGDGLGALAELSSVSALSALGIVDPARFKPVADTCLAAASRGMKTPADMATPWEHVWRTLACERFARLWGGPALPPEDLPC
jgi:hypothetical protein